MRLGFLISAISLLLLIGIVLGQYFYRKSVTADQPDIEFLDDDDDEVPKTGDSATASYLMGGAMVLAAAYLLLRRRVHSK